MSGLGRLSSILSIMKRKDTKGEGRLICPKLIKCLVGS